MKGERETQTYRRVILRKARGELKLARLWKRARDEETRRKFRLGEIGASLGWDELSAEALTRRIDVLARLVSDETSHPDLRERGYEHLAGKGNRSLAPEPRPFVSADAIRARRRRQIALGARLLGHGFDDVDPAILTGALLLAEQRAEGSDP